MLVKMVIRWSCFGRRIYNTNGGENLSPNRPVLKTDRYVISRFIICFHLFLRKCNVLVNINVATLMQPFIIVTFF